MNNNCKIIGISGGTGSGKTALAESISLDFPKSSVLIIEQDSYYKDLSNLKMEKRNLVNYDHPESIDFLLLLDHLNKIKNGIKVKIPIYNFATHTRENYSRSVEKKDIIIIEGIFVFFNKNIRDLFDVKLFIDTADDLRIIRRIIRDKKQRDRSLKHILKQYTETTRPMHIKFVEPTKEYADIIVQQKGEKINSLNKIKKEIMPIIDNYLK
tara:strand:- start:1248 stop:1880 length:633 start_codon:yes stop_codon:yes gene_type:complete